MHKQVTVISEPWGASNNPDHADMYNEIRSIWESEGLGNDLYYWPWDPDTEELYPAIAAYIQEHGLTGPIKLHFSW